MSELPKISDRLIELLRAGDRNSKIEALVVHQTQANGETSERHKARALQSRLEGIRARAQSQQVLTEKFVVKYQKSAGSSGKLLEPLRVAPISNSVLPVTQVEVTMRSINILEDDPAVVAVIPNQNVRLIEPKEIEYHDLIKQELKDKVTWGLKELRVPELWKKVKSKGQGVRVAVLDTGVHGDHPALANRVKEFVVIDPLGRRVKCQPTFDAGQHGTHVCGTIAGGLTDQGVAIGISPDVELFVAGVLIGQSTLSTLLEGIGWATEKGVDIINMSLGFTYYEPRFAEILHFLKEQYDILSVVAIGNENHGNSSCPGNVRSAFSVGAVEKQKGGKVGVAFFSSGASLNFPGMIPPVIHKPDLVAPGHQVLSSIPPEQRNNGTFQYNYMSGSSMAAPHVTGVAALLMAADRTAGADRIVEALTKTAKHPDGATAAPDNRWGYGMIQPVEALAVLQS